MKTNNLSPIVVAYIEAALWSSTNEGGKTECLDGEYSLSDIHADTLQKMSDTCSKFVAENAEELKGIEDKQIGHDLWLTRNSHGTGFWDRPEVYGEENAKKLTDAAHKLGECNLYVGDDEKIHLM